MRSFRRRSVGSLGAAAFLSAAITLVSGQTPAPAANPDPSNPQPTAPQAQSVPQTTEGNAASPAPDSSSQDPTGPEASDQAGMFVFKKNVEEIILHATVVDDQRRPVSGLDRSAFTITQNGVPQTLTSFRRQDVPVELGIVIDNSGSMRDKRDEVNRAVLNLIRASNPQDEIFVVNFSKKYYLDQDFTSDVNLLQTALHQVSSAGSTALYDAVVASANHLKNNSRLDKKALLVITDGEDNMSQETLSEALRQLQERSGSSGFAPTIYAIGLTGGGLEGRGRDALQRLAQGTGGVAYFPESLDRVSEITRTIAHDLRSEYIIAYRPRNQNGKRDDRPAKVEARAVGYGRLTVETRSGHSFAGQSPQ
jgi:Ca-activated chloride channel family protein